MAYPQSGNMLNYFIPNVPLADAGTVDVMGELDIGATGADHGEYICTKACTITRTMFIAVGEAVSGTTTAPQVLFKKRPTPLSATDESTISTLNVASGTAIGSGTYEDISEDMEVGDSIEVSWVVGSGTPTGIGLASFHCEDKPEDMANNSEMTATT